MSTPVSEPRCFVASMKAYLLYKVNNNLSWGVIVQELCESRGGRPRLSVLTSLLVSVDVKNY